MSLETLTSEVTLQLVRVLTGQLFTEEQIKNISKHSVGRHFTDMLPENIDTKSHKERIELAQKQIESAASIMADMKVELDTQKKTLTNLINDIDTKRADARKYGELAATNQNTISAIRHELEFALRAELTRQSQEGRILRRTISIFLWIVTLIIGAALGAYFREMVAFITNLAS